MTNHYKPTICIVGSGIGGGILALELAKFNNFIIKIIDTDSISKKYSQISENALRHNLVGHSFNQEATRGFGFGGSSNLWHGLITRLDDVDWRTLDSYAGQAISQEIIPLYDQLEEYFSNVPIKGALRMHSVAKKSSLYGPLVGGSFFQIKDFYLQKHPFRAREHLQKLSQSNADIQFVENATALYLQGSQFSRASGVVVNRNGALSEIAADYVVLAAGALETPRLVLQGNIESNLQIPNENLGKFLFDHPWCGIGEVVSKKGLFKLDLSDVFWAKTLKYRLGLRVSKYDAEGLVGSNHSIAIKPLFFGEYDVFKGALKALISTQLSFRGVYGIFKKFRLRDIAASGLLLVAEKLKLGTFVNRSIVFCYIEQPLRRESAVRLGGKRDSLGRIIPEIEWIISHHELEAVKSIQYEVGRSFGQSSDFYFSPYEVSTQNFSSGSHHAGSMRIGRDASDGVLDSDLKIFGVDNVYVCDLSIFPNYGNSNPSFTLGAFAKRLANHLYQAQKDGI